MTENIPINTFCLCFDHCLWWHQLEMVPLVTGAAAKEYLPHATWRKIDNVPPEDELLFAHDVLLLSE
jgi:hypothetical protein